MSAIFEFSSGILIIVIGLAMTHLLAGLGSIIRYRKNLQIDWVPIIWILVLLLVLVGWCYAVWDNLHDVEELEFSHFLVFFVTSILFYLGARLITPDINHTSVLNLRDAFLETKTAFFLCNAAGIGWIGIYVWTKDGFLNTVTTVEGGLGLVLIGLLIVGTIIQKRRDHLLLVVVWTLIYLWQQFIQGALRS